MFKRVGEFDIPAIDLIKNGLSFRRAMYCNQIVLDPLDEVIFECSLDNLVEEVRS